MRNGERSGEMSNWPLQHRRARNWDSKYVARTRCGAGHGTGCEWLGEKIEVGVGGGCLGRGNTMGHSSRYSRGSGLPADRPAGWAVGASGFPVGWQWVRPANQRITGVGERCKPTSSGGKKCPAASTGAVYTELSRILALADQCVYEHFTLHISTVQPVYGCRWPMGDGLWLSICSIDGLCERICDSHAFVAVDEDA
jgi:hypothetical protein